MSEVTETPVAEPGLLDYITRENAIERGETVEDTTKIAADADDTIVAEPVKTEPKAEPTTIDKRSREYRKVSIQQEIDTLTTKRHETQREYDATQAKLDSLRAEVASLEHKKTGQPDPSTIKADWQRYRDLPNAPKVDQFENYEDYLDARSDFIATERFNDLAQRKEAETSERARAANWQERLTKAKATDPTLETRIDAATPANQQMRDFVIDSKYGVELLAHLSADKPLAQRLAALHPLKCAEELARLETELRVNAAHSGPAHVPAISAAKPPIKPVDGSPTLASDDEPNPNEPLSAHIKRENAREDKARGGRR